MTNVSEMARYFSSRGYRVFPLVSNSKLPAVKGWQQVATTDPGQIQEWFQEETSFNLGIVADSQLVIDVDTPESHGKDGPATLQALETAHESLPETFVVRTASGGLHYYFYRPTEGSYEFLKGANRGGDGVDVQTGNAFLVGPGSVINGKTYEIVSSSEIANLPTWFADIIKVSTPKWRKEEYAGLPPKSPAYVRDVIRRILSYLDRCSKYGWNGPAWDQTTFVTACLLIEISNNPHNRYPLDAAYQDYLDHVPSDRDFGYKEHEAKWTSALRKVDGFQRTLHPDLEAEREASPWEEKLTQILSPTSQPIDLSSLKKSLIVRCKLKDIRFSEEKYATQLDRCYSLLSKVKDKDLANKWLESATKAMWRAMESPSP